MPKNVEGSIRGDRHMIISAFLLLLLQTGDWSEESPAERQERLTTSAKIEAERQLDRAKYFEEVAKLRAQRPANPANPAEIITRTPSEMADATFLALADMDEVLIKTGYRSEDPGAHNNPPVTAVELTADLIDKNSGACRTVLYSRDPTKAMAAEFLRSGIRKEDYPAMVLMCKAYWSGFLAGLKSRM